MVAPAADENVLPRPQPLLRGNLADCGGSGFAAEPRSSARLLLRSIPAGFPLRTPPSPPSTPPPPPAREEPESNVTAVVVTPSGEGSIEGVTACRPPENDENRDVLELPLSTPPRQPPTPPPPIPAVDVARFRPPSAKGFLFLTPRFAPPPPPIAPLSPVTELSGKLASLLSLAAGCGGEAAGPLSSLAEDRPRPRMPHPANWKKLRLREGRSGTPSSVPSSGRRTLLVRLLLWRPLLPLPLARRWLPSSSRKSASPPPRYSES